MTFGEKIQKLRKESGLSQEELSYQLDVSRQAISKWENDTAYPETEKIIRMSKLFNVTLDYLLNEETAVTDNRSTSDNLSGDKKTGKGYFRLIIVLFFICIGLAVWKPAWISFLFIPFCYLLYAIISKVNGGK